MYSNFGESSLANYKDHQKIGKGAYGQVYRCNDVKNKCVVALKAVSLILLRYEKNKSGQHVNAQLRFSQHFYSINIFVKRVGPQKYSHVEINRFRLKDVVIEQKKLYLVFQYLEKDLKAYMDEQKQMIDSQKVKKFLYGMLSGVAECHSKRIIHRDLKPANILLDSNDNIKIADFGLARTFSIPVRPYSQEVVTLWYRAPQILLGSMDYCTPIDIWSIGCIFAQMVTKRPLFAGDSNQDQLYRVFRIMGTPNEETWPGVTKLRDYKSTFPNWPAIQIQKVVNGLNLDNLGLDLLNRMLKYDPNVRITAKAALSHPYFKDMDQ